MRHKIIHRFSCLALLGFSFFATNVTACTGIQLKAKDGSFVNGRTVEFGVPLQLTALIAPREYEFKGTLPDGTAGLVYRSKYAVIGAGVFGVPSVLDGLNEKGLTAAAFYFQGYASYTTVTTKNKKMGLAPTEFTNWLLTQFATIEEVKQGLDNVVIVPTSQPEWGGVPPFHYIVYDKSGKSIVIEPLNGRLVVTDNPTGVFANSPTIGWQLTNLANFINLSPLNAPAKSIDGYQLKQFGQGSGLRGLPGDFTSPSRFVRAAIFSATAEPADNAYLAVLDAFHVLNQFDIPLGAVQFIENGKTNVEYTLATTVKDPQNLKYYFRTYDDQGIKVLSMASFQLSAEELKSVSMKGMQPVADISTTAQTGVKPVRAAIPVTASLPTDPSNPLITDQG